MLGQIGSELERERTMSSRNAMFSVSEVTTWRMTLARDRGRGVVVDEGFEVGGRDSAFGDGAR